MVPVGNRMADASLNQAAPQQLETEVDASWFLAWLMLEAVPESW